MKTTKYIISIALALSCAFGNVFAVNKAYYNSVNGKQDSQLREALTALVYSKHTTNVGYTWDFNDIDIVGGEVLDMYSTCVWTVSSDQCGGYSGICDCYNREHVVPQNLFNESLPQKGDRHHLFLTDGKINGMRSSYPFGETNVTTGFSGISNSEKALGKLGTSSGNFTGTVYEPDDEYKGDIARAIMYMAIRYATASDCRVGSGTSNSYPVTAWSSNAMFSSSLSTNYGLSNASVTVYMAWHRADPPSAKEIARNNGVEALQGNRNPFIDYPDLAEYLWGNRKGTAVVLDNLTPTFDSPCSGKLSTPNVTTVAGDGQITLTWTDVTGASSYTVHIGAGEGYTTECSNPSIGTITHSGTTNTCIITGLVNGLSYTTSVVAKGGTTCNSDADTDTSIPSATPSDVTVTFHANYDGADPATTTQTIPYNTATNLTANSFSRTGYTFQGWATSASGAKEYNNQQSVTLISNLELYAVWQKNSHDVTFNPAPTGATVTVNGQSTSPQSVAYGETVTIVITPDAAYNISSVTATGVTLSGEGNTRTFTMPDADVTVTVTMTPKPTYTIGFYNNGELIGTEQTVIQGQSATPPADLTPCEDYTFVGWWTATLATDNTTAQTWVTDFTATQDQNYYAVFSKTEGSGSGGSTNITLNASIDTSFPKDGITLTTSNGVLNNGTDYRIYKGATLTITSSVGNISSIAFTFDGSYNGGGWETSYTPNSSTWTSPACTSGSSGKQARITQIIVTVDGGGSSTTYYTTSPDCPTPCANEITITKGSDPVNGTFVLSNSGTVCIDEGNASTTVTAEPNDHYHLETVTTTGDVGSVGSISGNTCTITGINANTTINVTFAADPKDVVYWYVAGTPTAEEKYAGETLAGITAPTESDCDGKAFVGWTATADYSSETDAPDDLFNDPTTKTMPTGGTNYYAVFADGTTSGGPSNLIEYDGSGIVTLEEIDGVSQNGVSTYAAGNAPYLLKFDGDGDYIQFNLTSVPATLSFNYKMIGGGNTSTMTIKECATADGSYTDVQALTISGAQNSTGTLTTTTSFTKKYVRMVFTKGSNVGVGAITITGTGGGATYSNYSTSCVECTNKVTLTKGTESNGYFTLNKADGEYENCAVGGLVVHVTDIVPSENYQFKEITQEGIASGVTIDQVNKTVTYDKDVAGSSTINVVFEPKPTYTIRFYNGESLIGSAQSVISGNTPSVPDDPEACEGYTFVGWWTSPLPASNTESHIWVGDFTATDNQDYYAVYRHNEGGSGDATESIIFSDIYSTNTVVEEETISIGTHTSVTFTKGGSDTQYYTNGEAIRWYGGGTCVVASDAGNITGITFTFGSSDGNNMIEAVGYDEPTWTGEAASVTFTQSGTSGNRRIAGISVTIDGGGTAHYTTVFTCSGHTITVASAEHGSGESDKNRCDEGGTVTITLTADEGYECGGITTSPVVSVTEAAECTYTFSMPDADITVTPVFTPKEPRTFTFEKGTGICETATLTEAVWGGGVTLPTATANSGCDPEYVFAGWATAAVLTETEVRPTLYAAGTLYNGEETTLYAVYSQTTGGSASGFTLSYTIDDITYYVAARTGTYKYMGATTDVVDAARFTIVTSNDKQYLCWHGENDTYVSNNSNKTDLLFTTNIENAYSWDITETGNTIALVASSGRHFMFNTNIAQRDRFAAYSTDDVLVKGDAGTTVYNTNPSCVCYSVDITYNANGGTLAEGCGNVIGGECDRDWRLCDAPTRPGYLFTKWKDQNGTLYDAGATVSQLNLSLTLTAQWIPAPYTVLFDAGTGTCVASLTEASRGDGITLPKAEPSPACADDWTFVGWSATRLVGETNTSATIIGVAGVDYVPETDNVTLYAVYRTLSVEGATTDYTRVTAATPEEGDYVIVVAQSDESFGLVTYGAPNKGRLAYTEAYSILPSSTVSSPVATQIWHLTYDASGYAYLYNADAGAYLAASGTNITYNANGGSAFLFTRDPGTYGDYQCLNNTASESSNYYLGANKDADYVRYYGTSALIATNSVTLYAGSTGTRYYSTDPVCQECTDPEWSFEQGTSVVKTKGSEPFTNNVLKVHESSGAVTYSSTDESVATVDDAGEVTLVGTGSTTITLRLAKAMPYCAAVLQYELEVREPSIDVVGVTADGEIVIEHDLEGTITLDLSEGHAISTGTAANDLFFSKYFEAASNMKLFAIFNGTGHDMDISNIRVRCNCTTSGTSVWPSKTGDLGYVELRTISKLREQYPKMKIPSGTELIFWSNNKGSTSSTTARNTELRECITFTIGEMTYHYSDMEAMEIPNWFCLGSYTTYNTTDADGNNQFVFNGDDSMIMERYDETTGRWNPIDLFGAGTSADPASTEGLVDNISTEYEINGVMQALNDGNGFHAECAGNPIPLSTNRYMLVRKNSVLDGMHAVASNATSFATLCEEWDGTPVGGSSEGYCRSGKVFSEIAEYDYAQNYIDWETITKDDYDVEENEDGTTSVSFEAPLDLDARACSLLKIEVRDKTDNTKILATTEYKIPIVVKAGEHMTTDDLFKDQGDKCATCDVAILGSAVLTKADDEAANDMPEVRDIYVYGGGKLVIPAETHYRAHNLIMRMQMADDKVNVNVPNVKVDGSLTNQYGGEIRQQVRVGTSRFYQFAVPYPVRLEDVTFTDGSPAVYGEDFMIRYYDGEQRAQNLGTSSNWLNYDGTMLQPGVGYTLAVAKKAGHEQRELIFPMADASLVEGEPLTKQTTIHAWGDNSIRANHRGWNFLSNPYLTTYAENNLYGDASEMLTTGQLVPDPEHPGWWVNSGDAIPYVTLINSTRTDYSQEMVSMQELPPFTTFFIQAGDDDHHSGDEFSLTFSREHRKNAAPAYIRAEQKSPVARFGVLLSGNNAKDNCGVAICEDYSAAYDMQADLSKEFGSAYSLKLYTLQEDAMRMAFLATHPDSLVKPVPVGVRMPAAAEYTFSIDRRYDLGAFSHIYLTDNVSGQHVDLLDNTYSFSGTRAQNDSRFSLFVELRRDTPTGTENLLNGIYAIGRDGSLMLSGLPETAQIYVYDMNGRLILCRQTRAVTSVAYPLPTGVYQVRVVSCGAKALLRAIVH
ncbi:MAG: endonuclease [Paludibacteraceae bacterium]|nr:endonuclease [Paludibacteraceae bacterium]